MQHISQIIPGAIALLLEEDSDPEPQTPRKLKTFTCPDCGKTFHRMQLKTNPRCTRCKDAAYSKKGQP